MAVIDAIFSPTGQDTVATLAATTATAEIVLGSNGVLFAINATGDVIIKFGNSGMTAPNATSNFRIPAGTTATYDMGTGFDRIRLYNAGASTITYYIQGLSKV